MGKPNNNARAHPQHRHSRLPVSISKHINSFSFFHNSRGYSFVLLYSFLFCTYTSFIIIHPVFHPHALTLSCLSLNFLIIVTSTSAKTCIIWAFLPLIVFFFT
ncbi:hypothetical protein J3E74DRAFT_38398 [Bipolaris maydis]|nr:hypothetical protein J3E74DRAFT_38398 [Bipolaris maydis]KAJ6287183.1 hypothetical protein J3E71DRAFT_3261 [Bipolaris maydis]